VATLNLLNVIAQAIYDKKGFNILVLDVRGISTLADYYIIAEGNVGRHVSSLSSAIREAMHSQKIAPLHIEGEREGDWVVLDFGDVVIHLFTPEFRERYALEELWKESKIVDVKIRLEK
jgi:ribosome-associated protein